MSAVGLSKVVIMDSMTFDLLLNPHLLANLAPDLSRSDALKHLRTFLNLLQAEKAKNSAGAAGAAVGVQQDEPEVSVISQDQTPAISQRLASRKQAVLQLLCLHLCCVLRWELSALSSGLSLAQQQQLLDCLTGATDTQKTLSELGPDNVEETLDSLSPSMLFSLTLFFRWVLHSAVALNLPMPAGSKAQIHAAAKEATLNSLSTPELPVPVGGGGDQGGPLHQWLLRLVPLALKVLDSVAEQSAFCVMPAMDRVTIVDNAIAVDVEGESSKNGSPSKKRRKDASGSQQAHWKALVLLDLVRYHFAFEDYPRARKYVRDAAEWLKSDLEKADDVASKVHSGISEAIRVTDDHHTPSFQPCTSAAEAKHILRLLNQEEEEGEMPFYWRLNFELLLRDRRSPSPDEEEREQASERNLSARLERCHPPGMEHFVRSREEDAEDEEDVDDVYVGVEARKRKLLKALTAGEVTIPGGWREKINVTSKLSDGKSRYLKFCHLFLVNVRMFYNFLP